MRLAVPGDALCLGVLATQVFLDTYATEGIRPAIAAEVRRAFSTSAFDTLLACARTLVCLAERQSHLVGFAQLTLGAAHDLVRDPAPAELDRLYVQEPFTGQGIGSALLHEAESLAAARGASSLWLTPWVGNARALRFYARRGYRDLGTTWFHMQEERHENRVLHKSLAAAGSPAPSRQIESR